MENNSINKPNTITMHNTTTTTKTAKYKSTKKNPNKKQVKDSAGLMYRCQLDVPNIAILGSYIIYIISFYCLLAIPVLTFTSPGYSMIGCP